MPEKEKDARQTVHAKPDFPATIRNMNPSQIPANQPLSLEDQLIGINAKTAPYPAARSLKNEKDARQSMLSKKRCQANSAYSYDAAGRLTGINYSDATPDVSYTLDRAGRAVSVTDGGGTREQEWTGPGGALARVEHAVGEKDARQTVLTATMRQGG